MARLLLGALPFLIAGGAIYFALLTQHGINCYLAEKPPAFWIAALLIGVVLGVMTVVLLRLMAVAVGDLTRAEADFLAVNTKLATPAFIRAAHRKGKQVQVWTVNDPITMSVMISRVVDNIITDHPDLARRVLADRAAMSPVERMLVELAVFLNVTPAPASHGD